ncbi:MAG: 5'/3'-nucleotidase SurE [Nibricoccus sp.]
MRLLITNDDSLDCVFLHVLVHALRDTGHELFVVAPKTEQSWIGAAKSRHRRVHSSVVDRGFNCPTWIVDGTPSDCVNIGLAHLLPVKPDAVVSGINVGLNASLSFIPASGTIAGAWEGVVHGLPAIALSQHLTFGAFDKFKRDGGQPDSEVSRSLAASAAHAAKLVPELVASTPPRSFILHNLNFPFPCTATTEVRRTVPAQVIVPGLFSPQTDDGTHSFIFKLGEDIDPADGPLTDRAALNAGQISHTLLDYKKLCTL